MAAQSAPKRTDVIMLLNEIEHMLNALTEAVDSGSLSNQKEIDRHLKRKFLALARKIEGPKAR